MTTSASTTSGHELGWHIDALGWLYLIDAIVTALAAGSVLALVLGLAILANNPRGSSAAVLFGGASAVFVGLVAFVFAGTAYGLLRRQAWGRGAGIVAAVLSVVSFPLGTLLALYTFWALMKPESAAYFAPGSAPSGARADGPADQSEPPSP
jgi:hypothetical protein